MYGQFTFLRSYHCVYFLRIIFDHTDTYVKSNEENHYLNMIPLEIHI